jgi:hypothetical protein
MRIEYDRSDIKSTINAALLSAKACRTSIYIELTFDGFHITQKRPPRYQPHFQVTPIGAIKFFNVDKMRRNLVRVCCSKFHKGDRVFGEKPPYGDKSETHGFCESCFEKEMDELEKIGRLRPGWKERFEKPESW